MRHNITKVAGRLLVLAATALLPVLYGCEVDPLVADVPPEEGSPLSADPSFVYPGEESLICHRWQGSDMTFELRQGKGRSDALSASFVSDREILQAMVDRYADSRNLGIYDLLPEDRYELPQKAVLDAGSESVSITISISTPGPGTFLLPLVLMSGEHEIGVQFIEVVVSPETDINMDWLDRTPSVEEPRFVAIIEATENDIRNAGNYILYPDGTGSPQTKRPVFDMVVLFSANINYDEMQGKPVLYFNDDIRRILDNRDIFIQPLQDKGIKVLLSVMPNHQGIGFSNLDISGDRGMINGFAAELHDALQQYGLDGVMFDDEYADYPTTPESQQPGRPMVQLGSFHFLVKALRDLMPAVEGQAWKDRHNLITLYNIGPHSNAVTGGGGWGLFSNNFENIRTAKEKTIWADDYYGNTITADRLALRQWVQDEANQAVIDEISQIEAGGLFDYIWNANYARGDAYNRSSGLGFSSEDVCIAGMTEEVAKKKYGQASFEMSLEIDSYTGKIQHAARFWQLGDNDAGIEGRLEQIGTTLANQKNNGHESIICFNLQYVPEQKDGQPVENPYVTDFPSFMTQLGYEGEPVVLFEGANYDSLVPSYLR